MPFVPILKTAMVEIVYTVSGSIVENTLYFYRDAGVGPPSMTDLLNHLQNWRHTLVRERQGDHVHFKQMIARNLGSETAANVIDNDYFDELGLTTGGTPVPNNVSWVITFRTGKRGRSHRGRNYWIGMRTTQISGDSVLQAHANNVLPIYQALLPGGSYDPTPWVWVVASRFHNGEEREEGIVTPITAVNYTNLRVKTQRRRIFGFGT